MVYNKSGYHDKFSPQQMKLMNDKVEADKATRRTIQEQNEKDEIDSLKKYADRNVWENVFAIEHGGRLKITFKNKNTSESVDVELEYRDNFTKARKLLEME